MKNIVEDGRDHPCNRDALRRKRQATRLKDYDYAAEGYYFVTICIKNKQNLFGEIVDDKMVLNKYGEIVRECYLDLANHYANIKLDEYVIMPNHFHSIIIIDNEATDCIKQYENVGNGLKPFPTRRHGLPEIVRAFKTFSSRKINDTQPNVKFQWQKSYYDHFIRDNGSYDKVRDYIINNPLNWALDAENTEHVEIKGTV